MTGGQEERISVTDQRFTLITEFQIGRVFIGAYVICIIFVAVQNVSAIAIRRVNDHLTHADFDLMIDKVIPGIASN